MKYKDAMEFYKDRKENANLPSLSISDEEMLVVLGQWLGEFPITADTKRKNEDNYRYLSPEYLLRKKIVTQKDFNIVIKRFANILKMIGISEDNICFFDNFKRNELKELTFDCYLYDTDEVIKMKINFMTWLNCPELIIERNGVTTEYEHWYCKHDEPDRLGLQAVNKSLDNNRSIFYYTTHNEYNSKLVDNDNKLEINIKYPEQYESTDLDNPYVDYEMLEELLKDVVFPIDFKLLKDRITSCLKMDISKYEISLKALCNGDHVTYSFPESVNIHECHKDLALCVGDWMQAYSPCTRTFLPSNEVRRNVLTNNGIKSISRHFTQILKLAGLDVNNACDLMNFNKDDLSFDCVFEDDSVAHIQLFMSTDDDYSHRISIEYDGIVQVFSYSKGSLEENIPDNLFLKEITKDSALGVTFKHVVDNFEYYGVAYDDKCKLEIEISYPDDLSNTYPENPFVDSEKLEEIICVYCEYPFDIVNIYNSVIKCLKQNPANHRISIKAIRIENGKERVTDGIVCRGSHVDEFTITKRWKTITVKTNGAWDFDSLTWKVSKNIDNEIRYTIKDAVGDESMIDKCPTPAEVYREAKDDAEEVRKLAKSLVQPKKK